MNQLVAILLIGSFIAWCFALNFRSEKWAFAAWFPFTAAIVCGTLAWLSVIPGLGNSGGSAEGGFAALGAAMAFLYLLICPGILVVAIRFRPQRPSPGVVVPTVVLVAVGVPLLWALASHADTLPVHLTFKTTDGAVIPNVAITYETRFLGNGFAAKPLSGSVRTDAKGDATVYTRTTHEINLQFKCEGFAATSMRIGRAYPNLGGHQCSLGYEVQLPTDRWPQGRGAMWDLAIAEELTATIYLPRINEAALPYPDYDPAWAKTHP